LLKLSKQDTNALTLELVGQGASDESGKAAWADALSNSQGELTRDAH
jgi:hypothetical protein